MLEKLQSIDSTVLADIVRQDQRSSRYDITDWTVGPLSDRGIIHPDGLFLFSGHGLGMTILQFQIVSDGGLAAEVEEKR